MCHKPQSNEQSNPQHICRIYIKFALSEKYLKYKYTNFYSVREMKLIKEQQAGRTFKSIQYSRICFLCEF